MTTTKMTERQEQNRIDALLGMSEGHVRVLWGRVVERGRGLNFRIHGKHNRWQGVMETARGLL
jgi:hypothetical protein